MHFFLRRIFSFAMIRSVARIVKADSYSIHDLKNGEFSHITVTLKDLISSPCKNIVIPTVHIETTYFTMRDVGG